MNWLFLFTLLFTSPPHDIAMAKFDVIQNNETISLEVSFDREDLESTFGEHVEINEETVGNYLNKKTSWTFNNESPTIKVVSLSEDRLFYRVSCQFEGSYSNIKKIKVQNTCLLEQVDGHSNIVSFEVNGKYRMFRMHEGRQEIFVGY